MGGIREIFLVAITIREVYPQSTPLHYEAGFQRRLFHEIIFMNKQILLEGWSFVKWFLHKITPL